MMKCILIKTNLEFEVVELPEDDTFNDEVYKLLDCECWEGVPGAFGTYLMLDESGKIKNPPKQENLLASSLYTRSKFGIDVLAGDVLVSTIGIDAQGEYDLVTLPDDDIEIVLASLMLSKNTIIELLKEDN